MQCNIPQFLNGHQQLEPEEVVSTRRIASLRIYVEQAIEWIKDYCITNMMSILILHLAEHIISACAFCTLFDVPLVPVVSKADEVSK